jgi:TolB-like protein
MSPEQVRAKELDARSDLFSFGVVLYEMATGRLPFPDESTGVVFEAILNRAPIPPIRLNPELSQKLEDVIHKALEKNRNLRYQHASEMRADLQRLKRDREFGHTSAASAASGGLDKRAPHKTKQPGPVVAILEFQNLSGDASIDWLATGIAESLAADLKKLQSVRVVSSDRVRMVLQQTTKVDPSQSHPDYKFLGQQTGADWIVIGSYQRAGNRLRITPQLSDLRTGEIVSAGKADGTWDQIFELQDLVASQLIEALELTVYPSERERIVTPETLNLEAYEQYSKGRRSFNQLGKTALQEAHQHFARALAVDPEYAMAHAGLGATHAMRFIHRSAPDDLMQAKSHLERARELDVELAEPYPWLCYIYMRDGKLQAALDAGHRAIQLLPDLIQAHYFLALVYFVSCETDPSNYQSAANHLLQAARIEPRWQPTWFVLSFCPS